MIFLEEINSLHPTIKLTAKLFGESVTFLNTKVIRDGDSLVTDVYTKPTDTTSTSTVVAAILPIVRGV